MTASLSEMDESRGHDQIRPSRLISIYIPVLLPRVLQTKARRGGGGNPAPGPVFARLQAGPGTWVAEFA